jgi:DNA-binding response OmpR family regulator
MNKRTNRTIVICDTDIDHSFTLEGNLRDRNYDVVNITDATELVATVRSLLPSIVLANPDMQGFNEYDVCKQIKKELNIPFLLLLDRTSTHRAQLGNCEPDDVLTKPAEAGNLVNLVEKHISLHQSSPSNL